VMPYQSLRATSWQAASTASLSRHFDSDHFPMTIHKPMTLQEAKSIARYLRLTPRLLRGFEEQIFGADEQVRGRDQTYISDISLKVMWEKQRTNTFSHHRRVKRLNSIPLC
jgi:hypothetical protein